MFKREREINYFFYSWRYLSSEIWTNGRAR